MTELSETLGASARHARAPRLDLVGFAASKSPHDSLAIPEIQSAQADL